MSSFHMEFECDNAAFGEGAELEIGRILRLAAGDVQHGPGIGPIMDINGNKVGYWVWEQDEAEDDEDTAP